MSAEHSASGRRASTKRPPSDIARWALCSRAPSARQTTCSAIARRVLLGISGVDTCIPSTAHLSLSVFIQIYMKKRQIQMNYSLRLGIQHLFIKISQRFFFHFWAYASKYLVIGIMQEHSLLSMNWQWTYGPTLMSLRYHQHTALRLF